MFVLESTSFRFDWLSNVTFNLDVTELVPCFAFSAGSGILLTFAVKAAVSCSHANNSVTADLLHNVKAWTINPVRLSAHLGFESIARLVFASSTLCVHLSGDVSSLCKSVCKCV